MKTQIDRQQLGLAEAPGSSKPVLTHERVSAVAHRLWCLRGSQLDSPEEDWFEAERQLSQETARDNLHAA